MQRPGPELGNAYRLATGSLAQQASQVAGLVSMLAVVTVLARRLPLAEFGVYGVLSSLAGYLLVVQNAAAGSAVREMAAGRQRDATYSSALAVYALAGLAAGAVVAAVGLLLSAALELPDDVASDARSGSLLLGAVTALGWPLTLERDALRARQLFVRLAAVEVAGLLLYAGLVIGLAFADVDLTLLIAAGGSLPALVGLVALAAGRGPGRFRFSRAGVERRRLRELLGLAGWLSAAEASSPAIYAADRALLGVLESAAAVGLYEGPVRAHNVVRALNSAVTTTVLPAASRFVADDDRRRLRELLVRGLRYSLALAVPLTATGMALAAPLLEVWLGEDFRDGGTALAILLGFWLVYGASGVVNGILVAAGRAAQVARLAWAVVAANLLLTVALVPPLGLEGVAIATAVPYVLVTGPLVRLALREAPVPLGELLREAALPAWALGAGVAVGLALLHGPAGLPALPLALAAPPLAWVAFYAVWLRPPERRLVRDLLRRRQQDG